MIGLLAFAAVLAVLGALIAATAWHKSHPRLADRTPPSPGGAPRQPGGRHRRTTPHRR